MRKNIFSAFLVILVLLSMTACGSSHTSMPDPDKIVPGRESLVENLENSGYTITTLSSVEGSDLTLDRILAQKGDRFIDKYMDYLLRMPPKFLTCTAECTLMITIFLHKTVTMFIASAIREHLQKPALPQWGM